MIHPRVRLVIAVRAIGLALLIAFQVIAASAQLPVAGQAPVAPPYQWPRSHDYDVQHYRIVLSFDWSRKSIEGETTINLRPFKNNLKEIELDAGNMTINSVKLARGAPLKYRYENKEKLFVALDRSYPANGDLAITINYSATPKKGLTFITPDQSEPNRPHQIWSQGQTEDNHHWFPCYDYPNDKATAELISTVEEKYQVISNGEMVSVQANPAKKTKTWHWKMDRPFSSYLVSIVVGEFSTIKDRFKNVQVLSYVYPDQIENARLSFAKTGQMMAFFSQTIGYDYPHSRYAQTTVRDFGGGMENITATTLTDLTVYDRRALLDLSADGLLAHELAHTWFGNMLTCRDWGELWLNESFATFFDALWTEHDKGKDNYLYQTYGNQQAYFQSWSQGYRRPISTRRYINPDSVFDNYSYARGGAVLSMLRFVLGDESFFKAISHYVKKHQWQIVETQNLVVAIEEATGQNLQWFFDEWIYKMGHPEFEITSKYDEAARSLKLNVKQTQKPDEKRPWFASPEYFTMPVEIAITTSAGEQVHRVMIDRREMEFTFPANSKPLIINFDRGNHLIKSVKFDRGEEELAYQLLHDSDVMGRVLAAGELKASRSQAATKALAEATSRDKFWGVRVEAVKALSQLKTDASKAALIDSLKDKDSRVRATALQGLALFKDPKLASMYSNIIATDQSYFAIAEATKALGQSGSPQAYETLVAALNMQSWQDTIRAGALAGLAALKDSRALDIGLKYAAPGNAPGVRQAALAIVAEVGKGNDKSLAVILSALNEASLNVRVAALQALSTLGDARAIPALEDLAKTGDLPDLVKQWLNYTLARIRSANKK